MRGCAWRRCQGQLPLPHVPRHGPPLAHPRPTPHPIAAPPLAAAGNALEDPWVQADEGMFTRSVSPEAAPDVATYVDIDFEKGDPIAINGVEVRCWSCGIAVAVGLNTTGCTCAAAAAAARAPATAAAAVHNPVRISMAAALCATPGPAPLMVQPQSGCLPRTTPCQHTTSAAVPTPLPLSHLTANPCRCPPPRSSPSSTSWAAATASGGWTSWSRGSWA
jgi:hypothetical protein